MTALVAADISGSGDPVLLLHGFPETRRMCRDVAPLPAERFHRHRRRPGRARRERGARGDAGPRGRDEAVGGGTLVAHLAALGHERFAVVGHDRGGRVAYRMALDHPDTVTSLAVLDVLPVDAVWEHADDRLALWCELAERLAAHLRGA